MLGQFRGMAPGKRYLEACQRAHEYLEFYIQESRKEGDKTPQRNSASTNPRQSSMIQGLFIQTDDIQYIRSHILQGLMASQETIAVLVSNAIFLLSRNLKYWNQLRTEVSQIGEALFNFDALSNSNVIQNILKESELTLSFYLGWLAEYR
jgi:cytochrome P450